MADSLPLSVDVSSTGQLVTEAGAPLPTQPVPDEFFNMTLISFQVENTLFRVNKHGFNVPGTAFEAMFSLPSSETHGEGSSNEKPIHLGDMRANDFRAFLRAMYPFKERPPMTRFEDWIAVLTLSNLWEFTQIRNEAIAALSVRMPEKSVLQRIHLGRKFNVADWIRDAYVELLGKVKFPLEKLSEDPEFPLDWRTIAKLLNIRDVNYLNRLNFTESPYSGCCIHGSRQGSCTVWGCDMPLAVTSDDEILDCDVGILDRKVLLHAVNEVFRDELEVDSKDVTA